MPDSLERDGRMCRTRGEKTSKKVRLRRGWVLYRVIRMSQHYSSQLPLVSCAAADGSANKDLPTSSRKSPRVKHCSTSRGPEASTPDSVLQPQRQSLKGGEPVTVYGTLAKTCVPTPVIGAAGFPRSHIVETQDGRELRRTLAERPRTRSRLHTPQHTHRCSLGLSLWKCQ